MVLAIKRSLPAHWMPILKTKKARPFAYCGRERYRFMLVTKRGIAAVDRMAQEVNKSERFCNPSFSAIPREECTR